MRPVVLDYLLLCERDKDLLLLASIYEICCNMRGSSRSCWLFVDNHEL
jgi:hypothetical protein